MDGFLVEVSTVPSDTDGLAFDFITEGIEEGLDPVGKVVFRREDLGLFAEARGTSFLTLNGFCWNGFDCYTL